LAPIQIACTGHPSSSRLKNIDYLFTADMGFTDEEFSQVITEKWLGAPRGVGKISLLEFELSDVKKNAEQINIIVNGVIQKVSSDLISLCNEISERSDKEVIFHFFLTNSKQDLEFYAGMSILRRFLPNAKLHPFKDYNDYLKILATADFALPTLPFGGSHSNVDLINVGVPKLYIADKSDISGMTDCQMWESVGEEFGYCDSVEQLKERAVELCNSDQAICKFNAKISAINLTNNDVLDSTEDTRFLDAINKLF
jgi:predicted O-linked N-acetylglucosamine transferase (SPINDLY family)